MKIAGITNSQPQALSKDPIRHDLHDAAADRKPGKTVDADRFKDDGINLKTASAGYALRKLKTVDSVMNSAAKSIRTADEAMKNIGARIAQMKSSLSEIMKQYPPFPPGSEERVAILKSFSALRHQIDRLSFPPEDSGAQRILSASGNDEHPLQKVNLGFTLMEINVHRLPIDPGPDGLDIPDLPADATDEQISNTLDLLNGAQTILDRKRDLLTQDANRITQMQ